MSTGSEIILYTTEDGRASVQLRAEDGTIWLTQLEIAELFQTSKQNVSLHIQNILEEKELSQEATVKESLTVAAKAAIRPLPASNDAHVVVMGHREERV
ncbi:MAG: hypothetical protein ACFUZC_16270 [Chthoniobacteraceae bacterium]